MCFGFHQEKQMNKLQNHINDMLSSIEEFVKNMHIKSDKVRQEQMDMLEFETRDAPKEWVEEESEERD